MALGAYTPPNPFATTPDPGSLWDLIGQIAGNQAAPATPAPALAAVANPLPATPQPTPATPDKAWYQKISNPFEPAGNPWVEALRQFGLNMPFSSRLFTGERGIMNMNQMFGPLVKQGQQQAENRRFWGALKQTPGLTPQGMDLSALEASGIDPRQALALMRQTDQGVPMGNLPGYIEQMFPDATPEQKLALASTRIPRASVDDAMMKLAEGTSNAQQLRQEAEALGIPPEQMLIRGTVSSGGATAIRQRLNDLRKRKEEQAERGRYTQQAEQILGRALPPDLEPDIAKQLLNQRIQEQSQLRTFAQQERMRGITEAGIAARAAATAATSDERTRRNQIEKSFQDEANRYQSQITETLANKNRQLRQLDNNKAFGLVTPEEAQRQQQLIEQEFRATSGPYEDARDLARSEMRRFVNPVPGGKQSQLTADALAAQLEKTAHDPDYQDRLLRDTKKAVEANMIVGLTPDEFYTIRRRVLDRRR